MIVRVLIAAVIAILGVQASDAPAELRTSMDGESLRYELVNHSPYKVSEFEIYTQFLSGGFEALGCAVKAKVRTTADLVIRRGCQVPRDPTSGKPVAYSTRIVSVSFQNGLKWLPDSTAANN